VSAAVVGSQKSSETVPTSCSLVNDGPAAEAVPATSAKLTSTREAVRRTGRPYYDFLE
jgi:hypothetical protein